MEVPVDGIPATSVDSVTSKYSSSNRDFMQPTVSRRPLTKTQDKEVEIVKHSSSSRRLERDGEYEKRKDYDRTLEIRESEHAKRRDYNRSDERNGDHDKRNGDYDRRKDYNRAVDRESEHEKRKEYERTLERESEHEKRREYERAVERESEHEKRREHEREKEASREHREREREGDRERERDRDRERERDRSNREHSERGRDRDHDRHRTHRSTEQSEKRRRVDRSPSPIPEGGAGDSLSIEETNKLRLKLGLKPLEVDSGAPKQPSSTDVSKRAPADKNLPSYSDEWGDFLHKPATNIKDKMKAEKIREKLSQNKEKRFLEDRLKTVRTLGESDDEEDDVLKWVNRNKQIVDQKKEAERRVSYLENK